MVEDFRGDYDQLAAMMQASWKNNVTPPFIYSPEFLADCFRCPGSSFALAPTVYHDSEPVAFAVGYPRRVTVGGAEQRILISTFLTVAPEQQSSGYGIVVWTELLRRAAEAGFDGVVNYCVEGEAMDRMIHGLCRRLALPIVRAASFSYLAKSMWLGAPAGGAPLPGSSPERLVQAAERMPQNGAISRRWTLEEAEWELSRLGAVSVDAGIDSRPALLTGYVMSVADAVRTRCLVIREVHWGDHGREVRRALVEALVTKAVAAGARIAFLPVLGYDDVSPFVASGFVPADHTTHAYLTLWSDSAPSRPPDRYYLDLI